MSDYDAEKERIRDACYMHAIAFENDQNPIHAMIAFISAMDAGDTPPPNVMSWVKAIFEEQLESRKSLDKVAGLGPKPRNTLQNQMTVESCLKAMWQLRMMFGLEVNKAAEMVAGLGYLKYKKSRLVKEWNSAGNTWKTRFREEGFWSREERRKFLEAFPRELWPNIEMLDI